MSAFSIPSARYSCTNDASPQPTVPLSWRTVPNMQRFCFFPARIYPTAVLLLSFQNIRLKTPSPRLALSFFSGALKRKKPHGGPLMQPFIFICHRRRNVFSSPFLLESGPPRRRQAETEKPPAYRASVRSVPQTSSPIKMRKTRFVKRHP